MLRSDLIRLTLQSIVAHRTRSVLTALGIGIGVTAVVLLTSIGEGVHRYVIEQFTQFGTNTIGIQPGKANTMGISPSVFNSIRPLSLADAEAIQRAPYVLHSVPVVQGSPATVGTVGFRLVNLAGDERPLNGALVYRIVGAVGPSMMNEIVKRLPDQFSRRPSQKA